MDIFGQLKQRCRRNRDGNFATQCDRERVLVPVAKQIEDAGLRHLIATSLKPKHQCGRRRHPPDARFPASATGRPRSRELTAEQKALDRAARLTISAALGHEKGQVTAVYSGG
jgi:hypothetical protein